MSMRHARNACWVCATEPIARSRFSGHINSNSIAGNTEESLFESPGHKQIYKFNFTACNFLKQH